MLLGLDASTLTLNNVPHNLSIMITIFIIIIIGLINKWSYNIITNLYLDRQYKYENKEKNNFDYICKKIELITRTIYSIGQIIIHQILIYRALAGIINIIGGYDYESALLFISNTNFNKIESRFIVNFIIFIIFLFPLCLSKNIINIFSIKEFFFIYIYYFSYFNSISFLFNSIWK